MFISCKATVDLWIFAAFFDKSIRRCGQRGLSVDPLSPGTFDQRQQLRAQRQQQREVLAGDDVVHDVARDERREESAEDDQQLQQQRERDTNLCVIDPKSFGRLYSCELLS